VYLATQIKKLIGPQHKLLTTVTDVNPLALRVARRTAQENGVEEVEAIQCDLASALLARCAHAVDVILFNPPYVPTPDEEVGGTGIEASWAGGVRGRRVVDRALPQIAQLLRQPHGVAYLVTVDDNDPEQMATKLLQLGLVMRPVVRRKAHNENLTVHRLSWKQNKCLIC
jgi:release factor glutamine methyltransferase